MVVAYLGQSLESKNGKRENKKEIVEAGGLSTSSKN